jgi:hypothetical protein
VYAAARPSAVRNSTASVAQLGHVADLDQRAEALGEPAPAALVDRQLELEPCEPRPPATGPRVAEGEDVGLPAQAQAGDAHERLGPVVDEE